MSLVAGVDIGNSTTEVCIGRIRRGDIQFLSSATHATTGIKGTVDNIPGIVSALEEAMGKISLSTSDLEYIRLNESAPVIGDTAMETITETDPDSGEKDFIDCLNPGSLEVLTGAKVESSLAGATAPSFYQFMRQGYFCVDSKDSSPEHPVFNRSVSLKDSFKPAK